MIASWLTIAWGAPEGGLGATVGAGADGIAPWAGAAFTGGVSAGPWAVELDARGGPSASAATALGRGRLRYGWTAGPVIVGPVVGAGAELGPQRRPVLTAGVTARGATGAVRPRFELEYGWQPGGAPWQLLGLVGFVVTRPPSSPPVVADAPAPVQVPLEPAMVWVPPPVCAWLEPGQANERFAADASLLPGDRVDPARIADPGARASEPASTDGTLIVAAWPGDRVEVDGVPLPLERGIGTRPWPEGEAKITVTGGGRVERLEVAVAFDNALWVSAEPPPPFELRFTSGSDLIGPEGARTLAEAAAAAGDWSFTVAGSYSPEGDAARNRALAVARAERVRAALIAAGVPQDRVATGAPFPPAGGEPEEQRVARVVPVEAR